MKIEIDVNIAPATAGRIKGALKMLAENIEADNLIFLAELSKKPSANEKLKNNRGTIKMLL